MELTKKSVIDLNNRYAGCGVLFVKTCDNEIQIIEVNLGRNDKFYTMNGTELPDRLNELSAEIKAQEAEA